MSAPVGGVWASRTGDDQPTNFAATQAGLQAALDLPGGTGGCKVWFTERITGITNLTMYANTTLQGIGMNASELVRDAAATGIAIREKTLAEGNGTSGATGLWLRDFKLTGNASAGDGIDMGNQGGGQLNINAGIDHVFVSGFPSGTGMIINGNASYLNHVWSNSNQYGFNFDNGGSNKIYALWAEGNSAANLVCNDADNQFFGVHLEETVVGVVTNPSIDLLASNNTFYGVTISVQQPRTNLIILRSGQARNSFYTIRVGLSGSGSFTNTFYSDTFAVGTGNTNTVIPFILDSGTLAAYLYASNAGTFATITGSTINARALNVAGALVASSTAQIVGNITAGVAGTGFLATLGQGAADNSSATATLRSGTTGESVVIFDQNGTSLAKLFMTSSACFFDTRSGGGITFRDGLGGTQIGKIASTGALTVGNGSAPILKVLTGTAALNFDLTAVVVQDLTITVTGAAVSDVVILGVDNASVSATVQYSAWVSAANTVTVRARTAAVGENPASGTFRATVIQF